MSMIEMEPLKDSEIEEIEREFFGDFLWSLIKWLKGLAWWKVAIAGFVIGSAIGALLRVMF
jgi:hypothetical protein